MMKLTAMEKTALGLLCACAVFTAGFFTGRSTVRGKVVIEGDVGTAWQNGETEAAETASVQPTKKLVVNINTADADELCQLPGISTTLAERIVAYRTENGPFEHISDLCNVRGIGQKKYEAVCDNIRV